MNKPCVILLAMFYGACYYDPTEEPAPGCMDPETKYLQTMQVTSGFCPDLPTEIVSLTDIGQYPINENDTCKANIQNECYVQLHECKYVGDSCTVNYKTEIKFADDGATAIGFMSVAVICNGFSIVQEHTI